MEAKERIEKVLEETGYKAATLAARIGVPRNTIADIKCGRVKSVSQSLQKAICGEFPQFNPLWLLTGEGDILINGNKEVKNFDIKIGKDVRVINAGGNVTNSQNDGNPESHKSELAALRARIKELEADKKNLQNMVDFLMKSKG